MLKGLEDMPYGVMLKELDLFSLEKRQLCREGLISSLPLPRRRLSSSMAGGQGTGDVITVYREKYFHHEDSQEAAQVAQTGCAVATLEGFENLTG